MLPKTLALYECNGRISNVGITDFMESDVNTWNNVDKYFTKWNLHPDDIQLKFFNQIRGKTLNNNPIVPTMQNQVDTGIYCSAFGPKVFLVLPPLNFQALGSSLKFIKNKDHLPLAFTKSSTSSNSKFRTKIHTSMNTKGKDNSDIRTWSLPQQMVTKILILGCSLLPQTRKIKNYQKNKLHVFFLPSEKLSSFLSFQHLFY